VTSYLALLYQIPGAFDGVAINYLLSERALFLFEPGSAEEQYKRPGKTRETEL